MNSYSQLLQIKTDLNESIDSFLYQYQKYQSIQTLLQPITIEELQTTNEEIQMIMKSNMEALMMNKTILMMKESVRLTINSFMETLDSLCTDCKKDKNVIEQRNGVIQEYLQKNEKDLNENKEEQIIENDTSNNSIKEINLVIENEIKQQENKEINNLIINQNELNQLQQWTQTTYQSIVFDSDKDNWKRNQSCFDQLILNKKQLLFVIEDTNGNVFGGYIDRIIDKYILSSTRDNNGEFMEDYNSFIFSLRKEGSNNMIQFSIKENEALLSFILYEQYEGLLFSLGKDIFIMKEDNRNECVFKKNSFNYKGKTIIGNDEESKIETIENIDQSIIFGIKRIQVYQMIETEEQQKQKELIKQQNEQNEMKQLECQLPLLQSQWENEMKQIKEWTSLEYQSVIFDSEINHWRIGDSSFEERIFGKGNLVFLIEDTENNLFGGFIQSPIEIFRFYEDGEWQGNDIYDSQSFIFSLYSNERMNGFVKYEQKQMKKKRVFTLYQSSLGSLFDIGDNDITIMKSNFKNGCYCEQNTFNYGKQRNQLVGSESEDYPFEVKRIIVFQMYESDEIKQRKIESQQQKDKDLKTLTKLIQTDSIETNDSIELNEIRERIQILEELTQKQFNEILFDSTVCDWNIFTSEFDSRIFNKENIAILITDDENNVFGCFINSPIDSYRYIENDQWKGSRITDEDAFIFSFESNGRMDGLTIFPIQNEMKERAFGLYKNDSLLLFDIGGADIIIKKFNNKNKCYCEQYSFDYQNESNVLVGKEGRRNTFDIKRILVIEFI